jgi:hypothetical protein
MECELKKLIFTVVPLLIVVLAVSVTGNAILFPPASRSTATATTSGLGLTPKPASEQGITGNVTIEYTSPVCFIGRSPTPTTGPNLVVSSKKIVLIVQTSWVLIDGCIMSGTFQQALEPATYSVTLTSCLQSPNSFGCNHLPITVTVNPGVYTPVVVNIITEIV